MLQAFESWGMEKSLGRFVGMFAFALWDRWERTLYLVRDRLGIKPVYYGWVRGTLIFGSELKVIRALPGFEPRVDRGSLALLMRHGYIPHPYSIFEEIYKLAPGTILKVTAPGREAKPDEFWSAREVAERGCLFQTPDDPLRATDELERLLTESVRLRMLSDVPLGAFLSGGIDSSTVVALMQSLSGKPIRTFSIGFEETAYNEAHHAGAVARHLGTDHTELYVTPSEVRRVIPDLPQIYDEPFADSSQIPTCLISKLARRSVTVALSGDGGDELFAGYPRYALTNQWWHLINRFPAGSRRLGARMLEGLSTAVRRNVLQRATSVLPAAVQARRPIEQIERCANMLRQNTLDLLYRSAVSHWHQPEQFVAGGVEHLTALTDPLRSSGLSDPVLRMAYTDLVSYLPDDILTKVDRASMAVGLEVRVPLLDHRVVEFVWTLPMSLRVRAGKQKWLLRQLLYRHVPPYLVERPKMGFGVPIGEWLRGSLREWAEDLLNPARLKEEGFFDPKIVRQAWQDHLNQRRDLSQQLWIVLVFQCWHAFFETRGLVKVGAGCE
jgi:asparagine synthase (glutamine-hydrolysing)